LNERLKQLRTVLGLSQEAFGETVGVTKAAISRIESGINSLSDRMILSIVTQHNVNERWLRTGEGDMFIELSKDEQIEDFIGNLLSSEDDSFKRRLISGLAALDENGWNVLEKFLDSIQIKKG
jgi:transcriptional regulator with XRE-family HTH domain